MPSEVKQKIMEKLNRAQKCSILGHQNLESRGARPPPPGSASEMNNSSLKMKTDNDYCVPKKVPLIYDRKAVINEI